MIKKINHKNKLYKFNLEPQNSGDHKITDEIFKENVYQISLDSFRKNGNSITVVDLGANIGVFTAFIDSFREEFKNRNFKIISVEPMIQNFNLLIQNISNNNIKDVKTVQRAIAPFKDIVLMEYRGGSSRITLEGKERVKTITLLDLLEENRTEYIDVLKIDIEGAEYPLINMLQDDILQKIHYITMEFHKVNKREDFGNMIYKLSKHFNLHIIGSPERGGYIYGYSYYIN